jgi:nicotinamidase/pyrazinamidase
MRRAAFIGTGLQEDHIGARPRLDLQGADRVRAAAPALIEHAREHGLPLLLAADTHPDDDPVFESFPHHCVAGTPGEAFWTKLELADLPRVESAPDAVLPEEATALVIETPDHRRGIFQNPHTDAALRAADAELYVVFGGPVETDLRGAVMGLLARGKRVAVVSDALAFLDGERAASHLASMAAMGADFVSTERALTLA